jgi:membrane-bound serine protease (ClpP class)
MIKSALKYLVLFASLWLLVSAAYSGQVDLVTIEAVIGPISSRVITGAIEEAQTDGAEALVIELNTPGGLDESMREIIKRILASEVPVIIYISPSGSRAASAGVFMTISAHVAAMAPGTNIGAAHPVNIGGEMDSVMSEKIANDAAAYIKTLANKRGRNAEWAEEAVYKSVSITEYEALEKNVIDIVATDIRDLLNKCDGRAVELPDTSVILATKGATLKRIEISFANRVLEVISNPNIAYILMTIGMMGLYFEFANPGAIIPGVVGAICLLLAFFAFSTLPINYAGLLLILLGLILFIAELKVVSHGVLTIGAIVSLFFGSIMLIETDVPYMDISLSVIIPMVAAVAAFFIFAIWLALRAQGRKVATGVEGMVGEVGTASTDISESGTVHIHGEYWNAQSEKPITKGDRIRVVGVDRLVLKVEKLS